MAEFKQFMESIENKSDATKKQYRIQYNKLLKLTEKPIAETSEKKIIELLNDIENKNNSQALLNIALLVRKLNKLSVKQLEEKREKDKKKIFTAIKEKNVDLRENLPDYNEIVEYTDYLFEKSEYTDFIINWLLINIQVRNQDLDFTIVTRKKDANDKEKNYMWVQPNKLTYIRNVYKTAKINTPDGETGYGKKTNVITNPKMILAIKRVMGCQKSGLDCGTFIPNKSSIAYHLQKATYKQLGEGKYFKIVVNHFRNNLDKIKEISENRGTDIKTILNFYDIEK
jgi:hypothetical protein